jgi:hypothetical protein
MAANISSDFLREKKSIDESAIIRDGRLIHEKPEIIMIQFL